MCGTGPATYLGEVPFPKPRTNPSAAGISILCPQGFNGADLRNICTEAGMFAIRDERDYTVHEDFMKVRRRGEERKRCGKRGGTGLTAGLG